MDTNELFIFILAVFVGFEVISKVPSMLHTPLMSGTNAIHGIILFGGILVLADADSTLTRTLGFVAVVFGAANVFGDASSLMPRMNKTETPMMMRGTI